MKLVKKGKTKDVYVLDNGNYLLRFKDTVTGHPSGEADPGGNSVIGTVAGVAESALRVTKYYFELLKAKKVPTHYISCDPEKGEMEVRAVKLFGKGLEFVCRLVATGSFMRRFGDYAHEGEPLDYIFEVTLKDDERNDPPITEQILAALKLMTPKQYREVEKATRAITTIIRDDLAAKGMELYDIKFEFGVYDNSVILIDEISGGNMRVYKDGKKLSYTELSDLILQ